MKTSECENDMAFVSRTIMSCKTTEQLEVAYHLLMAFRNKHLVNKLIRDECEYTFVSSLVHILRDELIEKSKELPSVSPRKCGCGRCS